MKCSMVVLSEFSFNVFAEEISFKIFRIERKSFYRASKFKSSFSVCFKYSDYYNYFLRIPIIKKTPPYILFD